MAKSESEGLMQKIASKFTLLESRISSQSQLNDRVAHLESKLPSDLHSRLTQLEIKNPNHTILSDRMTRLESQMQPDPEHDRLITRINDKLDKMENAQLASSASAAKSTPVAARNTEDMDYYHDRIAKLTALRARYAKEEKELMG
jgi:hypothetical protein